MNFNNFKTLRRKIIWRKNSDEKSNWNIFTFKLWGEKIWSCLNKVGSASGAIFFLYRSEDPDPHQNKMDPKPCLKSKHKAKNGEVFSRCWSLGNWWVCLTSNWLNVQEDINFYVAKTNILNTTYRSPKNSKNGENGG